MDLTSYKLPTPSRLYTSEQALADEIYSYFNKDIRFPILMRIIKKLGQQKVRELFSEVKQSKEAKNPAALFLWKCKKN